MKKTLSLLLIVTMLFGLCACGSVNNTDNTNNETANITDKNDKDNTLSNSEEITEILYPDTMRKNGEYPENIQELTDEEINFHNKLIFDAIQTLDISILERYTDEKSASAVEALKNIKNDATYKQLFEKSFSDFRYIPSINYMLAKSTTYTFGKWYEDCEKEGSCPVNSVQDLTNQQVDEIYEKYYKEAPYTAAPFNSHCVYSRIVDGKIIYDIDGMFAQFGYISLSYLNPKGTEFSTNAYPQLILYNYEMLDLNEILKSGNCPRYKEILSKDLDKMVEIANNVNIPDDVFYKKYYTNYFKDDLTRKDIQKWVNENVEFVRLPHLVSIFIKPTMNKSFPFYNFSEREKEEIKDLNLAIYSHIGDFEKEFSSWNGYYDILEEMEADGAIELNKH